MRRRAVVLALALTGVAVPACAYAWSNQSYVAAYLGNDIGAPAQTYDPIAIDPADPPSIRLAVAGDVGTGDTNEYQTAAAMDAAEEERAFDALLLLGDNVYPSGDPDALHERVFDPFADVLDGSTEVLAVLGNHDVRNENGPAQAAALEMPGPWYSVEFDNTLVVFLDSNQPGALEQRQWLESTLAESTATWRIVALHHPAFSAGWHGSDRGVQANFVPLFEAYDVDLVLSGHDHDYQRSKEINGVTYVVTGAAAKLRPAGRADFTEVSWSTYNFVDLAVYEDRIVGQAIDHDERAIDTFEIVHS